MVAGIQIQGTSGFDLSGLPDEDTNLVSDWLNSHGFTGGAAANPAQAAWYYNNITGNSQTNADNLTSSSAAWKARAANRGIKPAARAFTGLAQSLALAGATAGIGSAYSPFISSLTGFSPGATGMSAGSSGITAGMGSSGFAPSDQILWNTPGQSINWAPMGQSIGGLPGSGTGVTGFLSGTSPEYGMAKSAASNLSTASKVLQAGQLAGGLFTGKPQQQILAEQRNGNPSPNVNDVPQFFPKRPQASGRPESLSALNGFSPEQERSALATRGQNVGLGGDEQSYYRNLIQRSLIGDGGQVDTNNPNSLLPVESSYLSKQGYNTSDILKLLQQMQA